MTILISCIYDALPPVPWQRARKHGKVHFNPKEYDEYKRGLAMFLRGNYASLVAEVPKPKTPERKTWVAENRFGAFVQIGMGKDNGADSDNFLKSVSDSLELSGIIANDTQIDFSSVFKWVETERRPFVSLMLFQYDPEHIKLIAKATRNIWGRAFSQPLEYADFLQEGI